MPIAPKVLAEGQIASTKSTVYTVPGATSTYVRQMRVYNTSPTTQTVIIYLKPGATSRKFGRVVLAENESADIFDEAILLETGDLIEAETTTASVVDYIITGGEAT
jgi:hypothetical protein